MSDQFDPYYTWLGIPPQEQPPDHYRLLGVRRFENNPEVISNALGQRLAHIRSYESSERTDAAKQVLRELAQAGECFASAEKKGAYDRDLRQKDAPKLGRAPLEQQYAKPAGLQKVSTKVAVTVTQTAAEPAVFSEVTTGRSSSIPWQMLVLLAAGALGIFVLGGIVLAAGLYGAGLILNRPAKDPLIVQNPPETKPHEAEPIKAPGQAMRPNGTLMGPLGTTPAGEIPAGPTPPSGASFVPPAVPDANTPDPTPTPETPPLPSQPAGEILPSPRDLSVYRSQVNKVYYFAIVGNGSGTVYGDNPYTDDSKLETAAVHAGVLQVGKPGVVKVTILRGMSGYRGSLRNGVTSWNWGTYAGSYTVEAAPETVAKTSEPTVTPTVTPAPAPDPTPRETRLAVPSDEAQQKALQVIQSTYKPIVKGTGKKTLSESKKDQAEDMLNAAESEPDSAVVYGLLSESRRLYLEAGDMEGAFAVVETMVTKFAHKPSQVESETLRQAFKAADTSSEKKALSEIARRVTEVALADAEFAAARDSAEIAEKLGDTKLKKDAREWLESATRALEQEAGHVAALKKLLVLPDDGEANQTCGRFLCLVKRDWPRGLPHLAKANHAGLKEAAAADLAGPTTADAQVALADQWWQLAEPLPAGREKDSLQLHSCDWYERAIPSATGVNRDRAAARVKEMQEHSGAESGPRGATVEVLPDPGYLSAHVRLKDKVFYFDVVGSASGSLYGTGVYTTDSSLATAAVHAGVLKAGQAGVVKVTILPGRPNYVSKTQNGVTSSDWTAYDASYKVERGPKTGIHRPSKAGKSSTGKSSTGKSSTGKSSARKIKEGFGSGP